MLRKLKVNPLKNSHCLKRDKDSELKSDLEFAQVLGILGMILIFSFQIPSLEFLFLLF